MMCGRCSKTICVASGVVTPNKKRGTKHESDWRKATHRLKLFVAGSGARSIRAIRNVLRICENHLPGRYELEVVDIYREPARAGSDDIVAIPTLVQESPGKRRQIVGDLSELGLVRSRLGI